MIYDKENNLFDEKENLIINKKLSPKEINLIFIKIIFPDELSLNYKEEYNKTVSLPKNAPEIDKV